MLQVFTGILVSPLVFIIQDVVSEQYDPDMMILGGTLFEVLFEIVFYPVTKLTIRKSSEYIGRS
ncbi:hypothetical protein SAMN02910456_01312 [Ruminococcaceae bacterium YRB3002]|nr:hypothetical protein SAMN02910456_01312 [Ruminococcaceae bacterium YRB3002]